MPSIIKIGLMPRKLLLQYGLSFVDIADHNIIDKRANNYLDEYVPFHFHPYSSFDYAVKINNPDKQFAYICLKRDFARYSGFKVIPSHPLSGESPELYDYDEGFNLIDWETVESCNFNSHLSKQIKMAECLSPKTIPASLFQNVYVKDDNTRLYIQSLFIQNGIEDQPPYVNVMPEWFLLR